MDSLSTTKIPVEPAASAKNPAFETSVRATKIPDAFRDGLAKIPNNPIVAAGFEAIYKGGKRARNLVEGWEQNEVGGLSYAHRGLRNGRILVYPELERCPNADPSIATLALWRFVESLNAFTADVALAVLAQMCEPSAGDRPKHPLCQPVIITSDAILRYKGISRRGEERRILRARIHDEINKLRHLRLRVESFSAYNPHSKRYEQVAWDNDVLFDIVQVRLSSQILHGESKQIETEWSVRAGQWAYWWLSPEARVYVGRMAKFLLELDHRRNPALMAKKIGQHCLMLAQAVRQPTLYLRIGNLLQDIGELPRPEARNKHWAGVTRQHFEEALVQLGPSNSDDGNIFTKIDWPDGYGPCDFDRFRGWTDGWLAAHITISVSAAEKTNQTSPPQLRTITTSDNLGHLIRKTRLECKPFWTQKTLAQFLGISNCYLSQIETNKRPPTDALEVNIRQWLQSHQQLEFD
jgi:DNA-binding XRE family transcriptional regulator